MDAEKLIAIYAAPVSVAITVAQKTKSFVDKVKIPGLPK